MKIKKLKNIKTISIKGEVFEFDNEGFADIPNEFKKYAETSNYVEVSKKENSKEKKETKETKKK